MQKLLILLLSVFVIASCTTEQTATSESTTATVSGKIDNAISDWGWKNGVF